MMNRLLLYWNLWIFLEPVIGVAIEPKTQKDMDKLSNGLAKLAEEDPTLQ